eukprot:2911321-Prymnesium_polylepis.1
MSSAFPGLQSPVPVSPTLRMTLRLGTHGPSPGLRPRTTVPNPHQSRPSAGDCSPKSQRFAL